MNRWEEAEGCLFENWINDQWKLALQSGSLEGDEEKGEPLRAWKQTQTGYEVIKQSRQISLGMQREPWHDQKNKLGSNLGSHDGFQK